MKTFLFLLLRLLISAEQNSLSLFQQLHLCNCIAQSIKQCLKKCSHCSHFRLWTLPLLFKSCLCCCSATGSAAGVRGKEAEKCCQLAGIELLEVVGLGQFQTIHCILIQICGAQAWFKELNYMMWQYGCKLWVTKLYFSHVNNTAQ